MMIKLVQIIAEYIGIILCLHVIAKEKKEINIYNVIVFFLNVIIWLYIDKGTPNSMLLNMVIYFLLFAYTRMCLVKKCFEALKVWGIMMLVIPSLQLSIYFILKMIFKESFDAMQASIITNLIICSFFWLWKDKYYSAIIILLKRHLILILTILFGMSILYLFFLYQRIENVQAEIIFQVVGGIWIVVLLLELFLTTERERKNKEKELQLYQIYNKSFEEAIVAIRQRQHEFDNHINAIKSMQYSIENSDELRQAQCQYCDKILLENSLNRLLKQNIEPIVVGALYSKLTSAQNENIEVNQNVHAINFRDMIDIVELIEILGILIDNAVEELRDKVSEQRVLNVQIIAEDEKHFSIEIANTSRKIPNSEIEKFCRNGYSTKGINRGMGIPRLIAIAKKNKAELSMGNVNYEGINYFRVKVLI
ncbi:MAG: GHKL domain-containing protein [Lachnospiraceae bacterium]|nr:GHKL domain-containing protein [Lachnospiraceae bacterium]